MSKIDLSEIYQHKLNFLIGSGASSGLFPTLWLPLKVSEDDDRNETIETLATKLDKLAESDVRYKKHYTLLFMYYYESIIKPICQFKVDDHAESEECSCSKDEECEACKKISAIDNYKSFLESIIRLLQHKRNFEKRCNLFTTNYDGCIPLVADDLIKKGHLNFHLNDGASGFVERTLSAKNFDRYLCQSGVFGRNSSDIPQINLVNLHGSSYWYKSKDVIKVDYSGSNREVMVPESAKEALAEFSTIICDESKSLTDLESDQFDLSDDDQDSFWEKYNELPIVNPTKWKFHETVFEEHYYQMLRFLSYSLEEQNTVLISFAFSFADEHIRNLVKRSLSNHSLQTFICCFDEREYDVMHGFFSGYKNVNLVCLEGKNLDFSAFNTDVFNTEAIKVENQ